MTPDGGLAGTTGMFFLLIISARARQRNNHDL
jgi:hypothetical protein